MRRSAVLGVELEAMECRFASAGGGSAAELDLYQRLSNSQRRLLEALGLQRRARPVGAISLDDYLAQKAAGR